MTREQKLDRAVREAMRLIRGDGPISEDRADEAWRILHTALSTPADAPAPAEQEVGRRQPCGCPPGMALATCAGPVAAPPPRPDEDGECQYCETVGGHEPNCPNGPTPRGTGRSPKEGK